ncbi:baseplate J/gp47 family protein [Nitrosomonas sp.]|uniref:baseplate J/gp47 family protein n=1 Tax=Nitrosomonas sp. TaxID=42353 RepID=UPI00208BB98F|nr:baseplate J/gp47 family protein [Nitrosomonas sp.]GJL74441.1 MAG: hypothetical protein NMNS02_05470 [Nitrosomonas sp.]
MPIQIPNLDDRNYDDLVKEVISLIPRYAPTWTNYNPSDPGITLIELLAYFTEMHIYRLDRVGRENKINFLRLLLGFTDEIDSELEDCSIEDIEQRIRQAVLGLRQPQRAVTSEDYEFLARQAVLSVCGEEHYDCRVHCIVGKKLVDSGNDRDVDCPGHISLIVVVDSHKIPVTYEDLLQKVQEYLEPKRLLTTRLHIIQPCYVCVAMSVSIQPRFDASWEGVQNSAQDKLNQFFNPVAGGGLDKKGWPFGRSLYLSEVYDVLEDVSGVDYIDTVSIHRLSLMEDDLSKDQAIIGVQIGISSTVGVDTLLGSKFSDFERIIPDNHGKIAGIKLKPYELINIRVRKEDVKRTGGIDVSNNTMTGES